MAGRAREDHLVREEGLEADAAVPAGGAYNPELAVGHALHHGVRVRDGEEDAHAGMLALELAEDDRNGDRRRPSRGAEHQVAGEVALDARSHVRDEVLFEREHPLRGAIGPPARLGRLDAAARTIEELRAE